MKHVKRKVLFDRVFIIISAILLVLIAASAVYYYSTHYRTTDSIAAKVTFESETMPINESAVEQTLAYLSIQNASITRATVIERLAELEVLRARARHLGITPTADQIEAAMAKQIATYESQGLNESLARSNISRATFESNLRKSVTQNLVLQQLFSQEVLSKVQVSDEEVKKYYDANPSQFQVPETVFVKHILICYVGAPLCQSNLTKDQAKALIDSLYSRITQHNESFETLAQNYSVDTGSAVRGGDLGPVTKGQTVPQFEKVAFETPAGAVSAPFESQYGYHILFVYSKQPQQQLAYSQVVDQLRQQLVLQHANELQQAYIAGLMATAKVDVYNNSNSQ